MRIHAYFKFTNKNVFLNVYKESNAKIVPLLFQTLTLTMKSFSKEEVIIENSQEGVLDQLVLFSKVLIN